MPYKYSSEVQFEGGLTLLGIPVAENKNTMKFMIKNTTVNDRIKLNSGELAALVADLIKKEQATNWNKSESFWLQNRTDSLTGHEKNIYRMVDSLKVNKRFQQDVKLVAFAGSGYWDFGKQLRIGPHSSFISRNSVEGWRFRLGFFTMPGISKKINLFGYAAYGTKDKKLKGMLGIKYVWNEARWTKTTISYGSDYDFLIEQDDELDKDNLIHSLLRKNVPFSRMYVKHAVIKHEQYLSPDFSARGSLGFKELNPVFDFKYHPVSGQIENVYDSGLKRNYLWRKFLMESGMLMRNILRYLIMITLKLEHFLPFLP